MPSFYIFKKAYSEFKMSTFLKQITAKNHLKNQKIQYFQHSI
jgi:hypothetical protein